MIKYLRLVHLYLGLFFAPTIIFFSFSGMLQTFSFHENHNGLPGIPWVTALAEIHKNQRVPDTWTAKEPAQTAAKPAAVPEKPAPTQESSAKPATAAPAALTQSAAAAKKSEHDEDEDDDARPAANTAKPAGNTAPTNPAPPKRRAKSFPLKVFTGLMGIGLIVSSLLGIYMAFKYARGPVLILGLLIAGTALPIALLYM